MTLLAYPRSFGEIFNDVWHKRAAIPLYVWQNSGSFLTKTLRISLSNSGIVYGHTDMTKMNARKMTV